MAREQARLDIDIAAFNEVRFAEQGSSREMKQAISFYGLVRTRRRARLSGIGFVIKASIARKLQNLPVGHLVRIMSLRFPIQDNKFVTVLIV